MGRTDVYTVQQLRTLTLFFFPCHIPSIGIQFTTHNFKFWWHFWNLARATGTLISGNWLIKRSFGTTATALSSQEEWKIFVEVMMLPERIKYNHNHLSIYNISVRSKKKVFFFTFDYIHFKRSDQVCKKFVILYFPILISFLYNHVLQCDPPDGSRFSNFLSLLHFAHIWYFL